jgi:hypothetical protein
VSYCRKWNDKNQVYLWADGLKAYCMGCTLLQGDRYSGGPNYPMKYAQENTVELTTRSAAILHLRHHKLMGHNFPCYAMKRLMAELRTEGERWCGPKRSFYAYRKLVAKAIAKVKRESKKRVLKAA